MNREIKFRAWCKHTKKFNIIDSAYHIRYWSSDPSCGPNQPISGMGWEQFTGLQDKNGKDIYKGDVYHQGDPSINYEVIFHGSSFVGKQTSCNSLAGIAFFQSSIEIIGNIHENPELLESQS